MKTPSWQWLFIYSLLAAPGIWACEWSIRDHALLIGLSRSEPTVQLTDLAGKRMECAQGDSLVLVRPEGANFLYILDTSSVFDRWTVTQALAQFNLRLLIATYISTTPSSQPELWKRYGRLVSLNRDAILEGLKDVKWKSIKLMNKDAY